MPSVGKITEKRVGDDMVYTDESGASYVLPGYAVKRGIGIELDPRIDLTKPIYEQVLKLGCQGQGSGEEASSNRCMTRGVLLDTHSLLWLRAGDRLPGICGYGDPGDCFLIATAHVENLTLVTRDARIIELANRRPDYLTVIPC